MDFNIWPKECDKLIISLRTAYANEYSLDKEQTSYSDSIDALRLACKMYKMKIITKYSKQFSVRRIGEISPFVVN